MKKNLVILFVFFAIASCTVQQSLQKSIVKEDFDKSLADSVLAYALDHEALFTLADTLKPMSSVKFLRYKLAKDSTMKDGDAIITRKDSLLNKVEAYQKVCKALSKGDWQFVLVPFERTEKNTRNLEIYVVRKSRFASVLRNNAAFFGQWGFTESTNPAVVITAVEYETRLDRNRAYGYLFGYPSYAVDFFVESTKKQEADSSKKLVPRDFFAMPVYAGNQGYFTYAMPKGHKPTAVDSTIYYRAKTILDNYKKIRPNYKTTQGLKATELWIKLNEEN